MIFYIKAQRMLYTFCHYLALPLLLVRLLWRSRRNFEYRRRWQERFGLVTRIEKPCIWLHAVSVGETLAAIPLIKALLKNYPHYQILVTSTTPTGSAMVAKNFDKQLINVYAPFDLPDCVGRFLARCQPQLGIIMETELWPNLLTACKRREIPLLLANARLSPHSLKGYGRLANMTRLMLDCLNIVAAQSPLDEQRFLKLGLDPQRLQSAGNIKFDIQLATDLVEKGKMLRAQYEGGVDRLIWVAASTHEGEEAIILAAFREIQTQFPQTLLILVPRHPDRFNKVANYCRTQNFSLALRSRNDQITTETEILLGDTMGELLLFYAAADLAFVGGSLVPVGGHNLIEAAALGLPVLLGPHLFNFVEVSGQFLSAGAAKIVNNQQEMVQKVVELFQDAHLRQQMGEIGRQVVVANQGAIDKHMSYIETLIRERERTTENLNLGFIK